MTLRITIRLFLLCLILLFGCRKNSPDNGNQTKTDTIAVHRELKGLQILQGNNQVGYAGFPLDTIIIKATLNTSGDGAPLAFYYKTEKGLDKFFITGQAKSGNDMILRAVWQPSATNPSKSVKLYVSAGCNLAELMNGTCKSLDSLTLNADYRHRWISRFTGNTGGYFVIRDLHFTDDHNGLAIGEGSGVIRTNDGGKTWMTGLPVRSDNSAYLLAFTGRDTALVNVVNNYAFFTYDGGNTFMQLTWVPPFIGDKSSAAYYLQNRNIIYSVGSNGGIAKTKDGGKTWDLTGSFNILNRLQALEHIGKDTLFTCGDVGFIARTTDAGATWKQQPVQLNNHLYALYFINNLVGFAAGQYGALVRTTDGGLHWTKIATGMSFNIIGIRFFGNHGLAVSSGGEIAETADAGLTWTLRMKDNYGASSLSRVVIKDEKSIYGLQGSSILFYDLSQQ